MPREVFVVCALKGLGWVDIAEFDDEDSAFLKSQEISVTGVDKKVVRRLVGENSNNWIQTVCRAPHKIN